MNLYFVLFFISFLSAKIFALNEDDKREETYYRIVEAPPQSLAKLKKMIATGQTKQLKEALEKNPTSIHKVDSRGFNLFHHALTQRVSLEMLQFLYQLGSNINLQTKKKISPIHTAFYNNSGIEIVEFLLTNGADINAQDNYGYTPANLAAKYNKLPILQKLVEHQADLNQVNIEEVTPLHNAVFHGHKEIVKFLLQQKKIDINKINKTGFTPFHSAVKNGDFALASLLFKAGAKIDTFTEQGYSPLHSAVIENNIDLIKLIMNALTHVDINATNKLGYSIIFDAVNLRDEKIIELILSKYQGKDFSSLNRFLNDGLTLMHLAAEKENYLLLDLLFDLGMDANVKTRDGVTALHRAALKGDERMIEYLLTKGAKLNSTDAKGDTPLHVAVREKVEPAIKTLLASGALITIENHAGRSVWELAVQAGSSILGLILNEIVIDITTLKTHLSLISLEQILGPVFIDADTPNPHQMVLAVNVLSYLSDESFKKVPSNKNARFLRTKNNLLKYLNKIFHCPFEGAENVFHDYVQSLAGSKNPEDFVRLNTLKNALNILHSKSFGSGYKKALLGKIAWNLKWVEKICDKLNEYKAESWLEANYPDGPQPAMLD